MLFGVLVFGAGPLALGSGSALAHEVQPAIVDLSFSEDGSYRIEIAINLEALIAEIGPDVQNTNESENAQDYNILRAAGPDELRRAFSEFEEKFLEGVYLKAGETNITPQVVEIIIPGVGDLDLARESVIVLGGQLPINAVTFTWAWDFQYGSSVVRIAGETPEESYSAYLVDGQASEPLPIAGVRHQGLAEVVLNYIVIGYTHILPKGIDHILFVVGLYLLSTHLRPLLWQVSAFTLAHTITLALGMAGVLSIPSSIVEPLIALSITYVCVENILTQKLTRWRPLVVFAFGLLHGLGFAGVLKEIGLAPDQFVTGLISFNVGVELGQLSIIAICFALVGIWFRNKSWYRAVVVIPASLVIGTIGAWWFVERTVLSA